jgi:hypothetical protein
MKTNTEAIEAIKRRRAMYDEKLTCFECGADLETPIEKEDRCCDICKDIMQFNGDYDEAYECNLAGKYR